MSECPRCGEPIEPPESTYDIGDGPTHARSCQPTEDYAVEQENENYRTLVAEMDALMALPSLSYEQAERWASLSNFRYLLYLDERTWVSKALQGPDGRWYLVQMHLPNIPSPEGYESPFTEEPR